MEAPSKSKKRKGPPQPSLSRGPKRTKIQSARTVLTQTSDSAFDNGALDLQSFLKAREFEIKALEDGIRRARGALTTRAFQQVPRDMRRRTASHNVKRVPKRLQKRAKREMREDNTPVVEPGKRKPGSTRSRLRAETAKRLGILAGKKQAGKAKLRSKDTVVSGTMMAGISGRDPVPKASKDILKAPPKPKSKFRKRQIHKTWLPTHLWHAKRARLTEPKNPLWRFAMPLTCTEKSYRPTHRAAGARGAVAWDMSYMSTIALDGSELALQKVLRGVGVMEDSTWGKAGQKWRDGKRTWCGWLSRDESGDRKVIGPATIFWCCPEEESTEELPKEASERLSTSSLVENAAKAQKPKIARRQLMVRTHPAGFLQAWETLVWLSKMQRPLVHVEDLRFELGSIDITGPGSTETLQGILHPFDEANESHAGAFRSLAGVTNAASLPQNALLTFSIMDPRLRYPPTKVTLPGAGDDAATFSLLETLSSWPIDQRQPSQLLFDRSTRYKATKLPSQKSLNRRKSLASPGAYAALTPADPPIPLVILASRSGGSSSAQGTYTVIAPWKCILPIWYGLMHYPLSSGGNPRFGGLQEIQQIHFEQGTPWYPADYPGTEAGWAWERMERERRRKEYEARPKAKRIAFESLDLAYGRKGEIGLGWACDFARLLSSSSSAPDCESGSRPPALQADGKEQVTIGDDPETLPIRHMPRSTFLSVLSNPTADLSPTAVATVRISLLSRGVPHPCARIYRLPSSAEPRPPPSTEPQPQASADTTIPATTAAPSTTSHTLPHDLRQQWLALAPTTPSRPTTKRNAQAHSLKKQQLQQRQPQRSTRSPALAAPEQRQRALVQQLLQTPPLPYPAAAEQHHPAVPGEEDLIGFVTTGNFNLAEGRGAAVGTLLVGRVLAGARTSRSRETKLCIVRNAGETVGRLARWEAV
ncbi:MAG: hypothetical protein M1818_008166 [Claussenomyces sp. TS43310]|nr:MAG: hypothetical protein M1818_008166 [Claussenomyces sp. TS43310]